MNIEPELNVLVIITFKQGLQPLIGYRTKVKKGFFKRSEVVVWESTEGTELDETMISGWQPLNDI